MTFSRITVDAGQMDGVPCIRRLRIHGRDSRRDARRRHERDHAGSSYLGVAGLIFLDAVCPVFPGETTLNAASTLAAQGTLSIWLVMLAGAVGAVLGDSALYWVSRLFLGSAGQAGGARQTERQARKRARTARRQRRGAPHRSLDETGARTVPRLECRLRHTAAVSAWALGA
jgi:hypothetical protein